MFLKGYFINIYIYTGMASLECLDCCVVDVEFTRARIMTVHVSKPAIDHDIITN